MATRSRASIEWWMLAVLVGLGIGLTAAVWRIEPFGIVVQDGHVEHLMDYAWIRGYACAVWSGDATAAGGSVYATDAQIRWTERWTGIAPTISFPFAYAPPALWLLGPTCGLSGRAAFALWTTTGVTALVLVARRARLRWWTLLALLTPVTVYTLALGQTALLATAGLLFLMTSDRDREADGQDTPRYLLTNAGVLWLLAAKPPFALTAGAALAARGRWRVIAAALTLTIASTIVLLPWLGPGWWRDYAVLLAGYDRAHLPSAMAWSIQPEGMSNLRAALSVDLGIADDAASRWSGAIWLITTGALVVAVPALRVGWSAAWGFAVLGLLSFGPHVSGTEDLVLCCVLASLDDRRVPRRVVATATVLAVGGLVLSPLFGPLAGTRPSWLFFAKLALAGVLLANARGKRSAPV